MLEYPDPLQSSHNLIGGVNITDGSDLYPKDMVAVYNGLADTHHPQGQGSQLCLQILCIEQA